MKCAPVHGRFSERLPVDIRWNTTDRWLSLQCFYSSVHKVAHFLQNFLQISVLKGKQIKYSEKCVSTLHLITSDTMYFFIQKITDNVDWFSARVWSRCVYADQGCSVQFCYLFYHKVMLFMARPPLITNVKWAIFRHQCLWQRCSNIKITTLALYVGWLAFAFLTLV